MIRLTDDHYVCASDIASIKVSCMSGVWRVEAHIRGSTNRIGEDAGFFIEQDGHEQDAQILAHCRARELAEKISESLARSR